MASCHKCGAIIKKKAGKPKKCKHCGPIDKGNNNGQDKNE